MYDDQDSLNPIYLKEISRYKLLTREDEARLSARIKKGDRTALDKLVNSNLRFVVSVAKNYLGQGLSYQELVNNGNVGLIKAAKRFDEKRNFKFISYASSWIRHDILEALAANSRIIYLPLKAVARIHYVKRAYDNLEQQYKRSPDADEIAKDLDMEYGDVIEAIKLHQRQLSLNSPADAEDGGSFLIDLIHNDEWQNTDYELNNKHVDRIVSELLDSREYREKKVLEFLFEAEYDLRKIGGIFNLTGERVGQIRDKALRELKSKLRKEGITSFVELCNR